jgi:hypothetical protein
MQCETKEAGFMEGLRTKNAVGDKRNGLHGGVENQKCSGRQKKRASWRG